MLHLGQKLYDGCSATADGAMSIILSEKSRSHYQVKLKKKIITILSPECVCPLSFPERTHDTTAETDHSS